MNNTIVQYLQQNKVAYTQDSLITQLRKSGHNENDITEAISAVYGKDSQILTPSGNVNTIKYAGFWIRFVASFIDCIIVGAITFPIMIVFGLMSGFVGDGTSIALNLLINALSILISLTYYIGLTHKYQATLGKRLCGLEVRSDDNVTKASLGYIILRETIGKFVSGIIFCIGYIMIAFTEKKQAAHDMIAKTVVVYKDPAKKSNTALIIIVGIVVIGAVLLILGVFASIVLVSLNSARNTAQNASIKAAVSATVPGAILCMENELDILSPQANSPICSGGEESDYMWPSLAEGGEWGDLIDGDVSDQTFMYTVRYGDDNTTVICTEAGCDFPVE